MVNHWLSKQECSWDFYGGWYDDLCRVAEEFGVEEYVRADKEAWRMYWDQNYTPRAALIEDATYWEVEG